MVTVASETPPSVVLSWTGGDPDGADTVVYDVYFGRDGDPPLVSTDQPETSYTPPPLDYRTYYYWRVVARDNHGEEVWGPVWTLYSGDEPLPLVPTGLSATAVSASEIDLAWTDNSSIALGVRIERKTGMAGTYAQLDAVPADFIAYADTTAASGTMYC